MVSWDEAFLILKKWRDGSSPLEYSQVVPLETPQGETITIASGLRFVRIVSVSPGSVTLKPEFSGETEELELIGTNAFSKKLENLKAACALHFAHYNFCRVHSSLRVTPAMAAGVVNEIWSLGQLLA
jgi:hypothetical protein